MYECYKTKQNRFQKHEKRINPNVHEYYETEELAKERFRQLRNEIEEEYDARGIFEKLMWRLLKIRKCAVMDER